MIEIYLRAKKPTTMLVGQTRIEVDNAHPKKLQIDEPSGFDFDYYFSTTNSLMYHCKLEFLNDEYSTKDKFVSLTKLPENSYLLEFLRQNECYLQKKCAKLAFDGNFLNCYQNGVLEIESELDVRYCEQLDFEIASAEVLNLPNNFYALKLYGKGRGEKCIILNASFASILSFDSCILEKTDQGFKVLTNINDIAGHGVVETYQIDDDCKKIDEYTVYMQDYAKNDVNQNVLPIYFLQCVKAKDFAEAKRCLSQDLQSKVKLEYLKKYFGDFEKVFCVDGKIFLQYVGSLNKHYAKEYHFSVANAKIISIS